ncbi:sulfotransferase domain-containing protein [Microbulbifer sp. SSSA002]|uniref:sulfotransferase domain-containing protein n=1 Tax=unclassified Microbulbifer TaxID=2619833 RepID=UPI0040390B9F
MEKNFILGVGCQKGGTSWLHSQLNKSKNVDTGFKKEYHVFDALHIPECKHFLTQKFKDLEAAPITQEASPEKGRLLKYLSFYMDTQNYYDYFDYLWHKGGPEVTTVGDITPSYSALPPTALNDIKLNLEERGFNVKVIFIMRDPIERCWSMVRMKRRKKLIADPSAHLPDEQKQLEAEFGLRTTEMRTRYETTIQNLELIFQPENIFYSLYEELFEENTIARIKKFLALNEFEADTKQRVNVSKKSDSLQELNRDLAERIFQHYRETYDFCQYRFGVKDQWSGWNYA